MEEPPSATAAVQQPLRWRRVPGDMVDLARIDRPTGSELRVPGDAELSFDDFVRRHHAALVRYAALLAGSAAQGEDLVQEVLIRIYPRWAALSARPGAVLAYVRRAVTNEHISWRRRWSTRHIRTTADGEVPDVIVDAIPVPRDEVLWQRVMRLPAQQRAALVLRYYEGLADSEIAAVLRCREVTVRTNVSRALSRLRDADPEGDDDAAA